MWPTLPLPCPCSCGLQLTRSSSRQLRWVTCTLNAETAHASLYSEEHGLSRWNGPDGSTSARAIVTWCYPQGVACSFWDEFQPSWFFISLGRYTITRRPHLVLFIKGDLAVQLRKGWVVYSYWLLCLATNIVCKLPGWNNSPVIMYLMFIAVTTLATQP